MRGFHRLTAVLMALLLAAALAVPACGGDESNQAVESGSEPMVVGEAAPEPTSEAVVPESAAPSPVPSPTAEVPQDGEESINGELLYAKLVAWEEAWSIFALDPATGIERRITHGFRDYNPDWSPDATQIVYENEVDTVNGIAVVNTDGSDPRTIAVEDQQAPTWSPDGNSIAYSRDGQIWVMGIDGSDPQPVTAGVPVAGWAPSWSPDGNSIAYVHSAATREISSGDGGAPTLVSLIELRVWTDGSPPSDRLLTDAYSIDQVDWSPDGSTLVFTGAPTQYHADSWEPGSPPRVHLIPADGGSVTTISPDGEGYAHSATWSPDREWIAYTSTHEAITLMRPDGSDHHQLVLGDDEGSEIQGLAWGVRAPTGTIPPTPTPVMPQGSTAELVLTANGLGVVEFGEEAEAAMSTLTRLLGDPDYDTTWGDPTSEYHEPLWPDCPGTTARLVAWDEAILVLLTDWDQTSSDPRVGVATPYLAGALLEWGSEVRTDAGVRVGDPLGVWRDAYDDRLFVAADRDQTEEYWVSVDGQESPNAATGGIRGPLVWPQYPNFPADPENNPEDLEQLIEIMEGPTDDWLVADVVSGAMCGYYARPVG